MRFHAILGNGSLLLAAFVGELRGAEVKLEFNRDVRAILTDACFSCHGADSASRKADLRLDQREAAIEMGAIAPGVPDESEMIRRILSDDPEEMMPPPKSHKKLTAEQKAILQRWVAEGAEYQPHWAFIPPHKPELPQVQRTAWIRNPIDRFILARLEAAGLAPAEEADRRTLARRVSFDLTGLPPTPEQVEEFVRDAAPEAYEKFVDRLLASPQWGEHRGRYWLDYARYADTHGIHFDNFREMWTYRDWVIAAFNQNMPFDQFTIENLAGDLLPNRTLDQQIGSGFHRCNMTTNEGGIIDEEYRVLYARDRTETTSQVWLALTTGCAVCHDHKFDPISQREFYELSAFFNNTTQGVRDGNIKDTPPIVAVALPEDRARSSALAAEIPVAKARVEARRKDARPEHDAWAAAAKAEEFVRRAPEEGLYLHAPLNEGSAAALQISVDGELRSTPLAKSAAWQGGPDGAAAILLQGAAAELADVGDFDGDQAFSTAVWVRLPANDGNGAIVARMDDANAYRGWDLWFEGRRIGTHIIHKWNEDALKVVSAAQAPANEWVHVLVAYDGSKKATGVKIYFNGQLQENQVQADSLKSSIRTTVPFKIGQRHSANPSSAVGVHDLRIYRRALGPADAAALAGVRGHLAVLAKPVDQRTDAEKEQLFNWWLGTLDKTSVDLNDEVRKLEREQADIKARSTIAHVMQERTDPATAFVLFRGDYDKRRDQVSPGTPAALIPFPEDLPRNRLGFAKWLLLPEHPLTARVTVNRFWQEVFGMGIVKSSGDFGVTGALPTHPELLDWLAVDFRASGWDVKRFFKQLVTSAAYRQAAVITPEKLEKDRENALLSRGPRFRLDAEMIRDNALAASGLLVTKIGGPSVKPYQPPGVWEAIAMTVSNTRSYQRESGEKLHRRSLYTFWKRQAPPASMDIFNAPNRELCTVRRERTNTPLQALVTLNDEQFIEAARYLAQRALTEGGSTTADRLNFIALRLLARPLRAEEQAVVEQSAADLLAHYQANPQEGSKLLAVGEVKPSEKIPPAELAAWTMVVNELMNLDEVLTK